MASSASTDIRVSTIQPISRFPIPGQITPVITQQSNIPSQQEVTQTIPPSSSSIIDLPSITKENNYRVSGPKSAIIEELTPVTDISPAVAMTESELACFHAVRYILRSHKQLTEEDIQFTANYISSFYAHSYDILQENPTAENLLNDEQLVIFLVYADQTGIARFALIFNEELDDAIKSKDTISLKKMLIGPKEMFIELYDNPYLSNEDREFIIRLISREMFATTLALGLLKKKILNLETIDDKCTSESLTMQAQKDEGVVNVAILATKCYDEVCIQDAKILEDDKARAQMSKYEKPAESIFTIDKPSSSTTPQVYCFNTLELISVMIDDVPINPKSQEPFSDYALKLIRQRFHKEIAMYRRYKEIKLSKSKPSSDPSIAVLPTPQISSVLPPSALLS